MSFLSRLFGGGARSAGPRSVEDELARLEAEADDAKPGYVGTSYNKAGDLALRDGQSERAVAFYGRAIDAFLEDGQREAARGVANKIIRVRPSAVRTLCTLTWLDLAARHHATALLHLRDYAQAAAEADEHARAAAQIYEMAKLSTDAEFVDAAADALDGLDFGGRAKEVRQWNAEQTPDAIEDPDELALACLAAAVRSSESPIELADEREVRGPDERAEPVAGITEGDERGQDGVDDARAAAGVEDVGAGAVTDDAGATSSDEGVEIAASDDDGPTDDEPSEVVEPQATRDGGESHPPRKKKRKNKKKKRKRRK